MTKKQLINRKKISIIAPVYNEELLIEKFINRVEDVISKNKKIYEFELILVDDGSRDSSLQKIQGLACKHHNIRIIQLRRNYGQTAALQAGIDAADGDIFITMDSDLQHFPEEIPAFINKLGEGYDLVCGWRKNRKEGIIRRWPSYVANRFISLISGLKINDFGTTYRAYRAEYARELRLLGESHRYLPVLIKNLGGKITEIPIKNIVRPSGKSNYGLGRTFGVMLDLVLLDFMTHYIDRPMRAFGNISLITFSIGILLILWITYDSLRLGVNAVQTRLGTFLTAVILIITSFQILLTGIISEILIRIFFNQSDQRVYKIYKEWDYQNIK
jgi:glycosyltransferase involved in cell wall biosynthesis